MSAAQILTYWLTILLIINYAQASMFILATNHGH